MLVIMLITGAVLATGLALIGNELLKKSRLMNAGVFVFIFLAVIVWGFFIYLKTPAGQRWIKNL